MLSIEFLASMSVVLVVFMRIRRPWSSYVHQKDGAHGIIEELQENKKAIREGQMMEEPNPDDEDDIIERHERKVQLFTPTASTTRFGHTYDKLQPGDTIKPLETSRSPSLTEKLSKLKQTDDFETSLKGISIVKLDYVIRVLIPCYKEDLDLVKGTAEAALKMHYDPSKLFVYICDDGNDLNKRRWVESQNISNLGYIVRPTKYKGHAKAGNLNYALRRVIYKDQRDISKKELVVILDADMIASTKFLNTLVPYFKHDRKVMMVQSPQTFHNVPMQADFFDAHNLNFFQYMLPAMDAWNTTTCCGTNFIVSARALSRIGWFPTISITEDMHLAIRLLENGAYIKYHAENLVVGEAPQDLRQIFQQRSRWAKGTIQIVMKENPLFNTRLTLIQRLSFFNAYWSYITAAFMNPLFVIINAIAVVFGLFPVQEITLGTAMLFALYYMLFFTMIHFTPNPNRHYISLWVVGKMGHFFSFMAMKAFFNVIKSSFKSGLLTFKVTKKKTKDKGRVNLTADLPEDGNLDEYDYGYEDSFTEEFSVDEDEYEDVENAQGLRDSSRKDIIYHFVVCSFIFLVIVYGIWLLFDGKLLLPEIEDERSFGQKKGIRLFCIFWMFQFLIAYSLPLWYALLPQDFLKQAKALKYLASLDTLISFSLIIVTICLFQFPWVQEVPKINNITDFVPSSQSYWITDSGSHKGISDYIERTAIRKEIPVLVVYERPGRDGEGLSAGGVNSYQAYNSALNDIAKKIQKIDFPVIVVLEPDWMFETIGLADSTMVGNNVFFFNQEVEDADGVLVDLSFKWDSDRWFFLLDMFMDFSNKLNFQTQVYVDAAHPKFQQALGYVPIEKLAESITDSIRGVSINVANFYNDTHLMEMGTKIHQDFNLFWISDTSRNAGEFSTRTFEEIDSCRFDPPLIRAGEVPQWSIDDEVDGTVRVANGMDANLWIKKAGEADGRLYPAGDFHSCLMIHDVECNSVCPEIPIESSFFPGVLYRPLECICD